MPRKARVEFAGAVYHLMELCRDSQTDPYPGPQKQWDEKVLKEGEKQTEKDGKRDYKTFGGDDGKTSGNCHTVTREIIEGAGGTIPKEYNPPGANPGLTKEKEQ